MDKEKALETFKEVINKEPWISPSWEVWAKASEEDKEILVLMCNLLAKFHPKSLGAIAVTFEKCNPNRQFIIYDGDLGHDPNFMSKYFKEEYQENE